jgi:6-phosphogluconolactonase (cycloisomerase 2 family)
MMPSTAPLLVFVTMFAANEAGGIQAFHLDTATGTLTPAAFTADCPNGFFLTLAPDRRTVYSLTAKKFGAADTEEVLAWRIADRDGRLEPLGRRSAKGPATCYVAADPKGRSLLLAREAGGAPSARDRPRAGGAERAAIRLRGRPRRRCDLRLPARWGHGRPRRQ